MNRIYWDTMLFIYLLDDRKPYSDRIESIFEWIRDRGDVLCTSAFTVGEILVAPNKTGDRILERKIMGFFDSGEIEVIPFQHEAAIRFAKIRSANNVSPADAVHLACAAPVGVDLFLTNEQKLRKVVVPGIRFIDGIETSLLAPSAA